MKKSFILICVLSFTISSCATLFGKPVPPMTYEQVIQLSQQHVAAEEIIQKLNTTNTFLKLSSDEVLDLRQKGVNSKVVDFMMESYTEEVRRNQAMEDFSRWAAYGGHYYWWPGWETYADRFVRPPRK